MTAEGVCGGECGEEKGMPEEQAGGDEEGMEMLAETSGLAASVRSQKRDALCWRKK